jgi:predicted AlkP superfamily pyrophosphatase or phosphodiesterase
MAEAKTGYYFSNEWQGDLLVKIDKSKIDEDDGNSYLATHGYDPLKPNYRTFFMASGAGIKKGVVIPSIRMIDEGPTMARLLGLDLPEADGKVLDEIIEK